MASLRTFFHRYRLPFILLLNILLTSGSYLIALGLRLDFHLRDALQESSDALPVLLLLFIRLSLYSIFGLNQGYWRYVSTSDLVQIGKAHVFSSCLFAASIFLFRVDNFPRSVIFIEFALSIIGAGGSRLIVRLLAERFIGREKHSEIREVIVLGGGESGHLFIKTLLSNRRLTLRPILVLDDQDRLQTTSVYGVPIRGGINHLEQCLDRFPRVCVVVLAIPSLSIEKIRQVESICERSGVQLKRVQSFEDLAFVDEVQTPGKISIEALLKREMTIERSEDVRKIFSGKRVLVTGGGGSIGSELVRQLLPFQPAHLTIVENSEFNLFRIKGEIENQSPNISKRFVLGDVRNMNRLLQTFQEERPEIIFHAAACKHVALLEQNCYEAFATNIVGTRNLLDCCSAVQASRFVMISTDKAVDPSSVMGASKRIAEILVHSSGRSQGRDASLIPSVVRFGNVINSAGSVIPIFREQILTGGPITVTHPDMERYFMSIPEAVRLVLTAGALGKAGEVYILNMGKPMKIVDVARKMLALYGRRDIPIVFTGIKPGEKLSEELLAQNERRDKTLLEKIDRVIVPYHDIDARGWILDMEKRLSSLNDRQVGEFLKEFAWETSEANLEQERAIA